MNLEDLCFRLELSLMKKISNVFFIYFVITNLVINFDTTHPLIYFGIKARLYYFVINNL